MGDVSGRVIEIGCGLGENLSFLPHGIDYHGFEPNEELRCVAKNVAFGVARRNTIVDYGKAERIPMEDGSADFVISTFVLCCVDNLEQSVREIRRVLRAGGHFIYIEHVVSPNPLLRYLQGRLSPCTRRLAYGCNLDRDPLRALQRAQFVPVSELVVPTSRWRILGPLVAGRVQKR